MSTFLNSTKKRLETKQVTETVRVLKIMEESVPTNYIKGSINVNGEVIPVMEIGFCFKKKPIQYTEIDNIVIIDIKVIDSSENGIVMDVVKKNIDSIGGTCLVKSVNKKGTITTVKLKMNLAIIEGLEILAGSVKYTIPIKYTGESLDFSEKDMIENTHESEIITIEGEKYPVSLIHKLFNIKTDIKSPNKGIVLMMEGYTKVPCQFKDTVVKENFSGLKLL